MTIYPVGLTTARPVVRGFDGMTRISVSKGWNQKDGESLNYRFKGPLDKAEAMYESLVGDISIDKLQMTPEEGSFVGVVEYSIFDAQVSAPPVGENDATWAVNPLEIQRPLKEHPWFQYASDAPAYVAIDHAIEHGEVYNITSSGACVKRYYKLRQKGVENYLDFGLELTRTFTVSSRSLIQASYAKVGQCMWLSQITNPPVPYAILGQLHNLWRLKEDTAGTGSTIIPASPAGFSDNSYNIMEFDWLKKMPRIGSSKNGRKWSITDVWWGAPYWSETLYGGTWLQGA